MDSVLFNAGKHAFAWPITFGGGIEGRTQTAHVSALGRSAGNGNGNGNGGVSSNGVLLESSTSSKFSFSYPFRSLWSGGSKGKQGIGVDNGVVVVVEDREETEDKEKELEEEKNGSWVLKILHVRSLWTEHGNNNNGAVGVLEREEEEERKEDEEEIDTSSEGCSCCEDDEEIDGCVVDAEEEGNAEFDRESFSRLLRRVSLSDAKIYARMSYLGNLAYAIPDIKPGSLLKHHGLRFVTSSLEKKVQSSDVEDEHTTVQVEGTENELSEASDELGEKKSGRSKISATAAYNIAASAASYLQSRTKNIISFKSSKSRDVKTVDSETHEEHDGTSSESEAEAASFVATTNSVTAVVAAEEETKQAVVKDLNSACSSPCEWFVCDDDQTGTRYFVIQGSETLASWQANLLFEPIKFEGLDVLVHRGIYEAAKGIYKQMLPEVQAHLKSRGNSATFRFTGHSLGGSLSLLVNLMLLIRGEVPMSSLLPVITFGAPSIMCGGDRLLRRLGLPRSHVQAITMHRDIVPRVFSCNYPEHVAELLKAVNVNFRNHPCLQNQRLLYAHMGEILILQPEEKFSPHHELLPSGGGLYLLRGSTSESEDPEKQLRAAQAVFFNSPHPLEILSDRSAYGSDGTIYRDHDVNSYLRSVLGVIRLELNQVRKTKRERRREAWWPLVTAQDGLGGIVLDPRVTLNNMTPLQPSFSGFLRTGRESLKRFSRLVASQHMHLLVLFLVPARSLLGAFAIIRFQ